MKRVYILHHTTSNGEKYEKEFNTIDEAQLSEALYGGWIELKIINGQCNG